MLSHMIRDGTSNLFLQYMHDDDSKLLIERRHPTCRTDITIVIIPEASPPDFHFG